MSSIRGRLLARLLPAWLVLLVLGALALEYGLESYLVRELDDGLADKARALATLVFDRGEEIEFQFADELMPEFSRDQETEYFEIVREDGTVLERSRSLKKLALPDAPAQISPAAHWDLVLPDGRSGRAVALHAQAHYEPLARADDGEEQHDSPFVIIRVARGKQELERFVTRMYWGVGAVVLVLAVAVTIIVMRAVRVGLEPLDRLGTAVAAIDERSPTLDPLGIGTNQMPTELQPIRERLDDLLVRLGAALERERRFTSDAAHELRTPIAELRALSEVALRWPEEGESVRKRWESTLTVARRMERIVAVLLSLGRADAGHDPDAIEQVNLAAMHAQLLESHAGTVAAKRLLVAVEGGGGDDVEADATRLCAVLRNLIDNAVQYAPEGSEIRIVTRTADDKALIEVSNANSTLTKDDLEHLIEPFWRKDRARGDRERAGLGLSLAAALANGIGGELDFELAGGRFLARLTLPTRIGALPAPVRTRS